MRKQIITIYKCLTILVALSVNFSCKKEHLQPTAPSGGNPGPLVFISAKLDSDSVYFAGGVNNYVGSTSVFDTLTYRTFVFTLSNPQPSMQYYFKISINNYDSILGNSQIDLDSSIYVSTRNYELANAVGDFTPLNVTVEWYDSSGVKYSSAEYLQSTLFSITAVEDVTFENKKYRKATAEFQCYLGINFINYIHLTNGKATMLFSAN